MQQTDEVGAPGVGIAVQAGAGEPALNLHDHATARGQHYGPDRHGEIDRVTVFRVVVAEGAVKPLLDARGVVRQRQQIEDVARRGTGVAGQAVQA